MSHGDLRPAGRGKVATFFMHMLRDWSASGSAIVLDPKGELYEQTAYRYRNVYRLDLPHPEISDRWNFVPSCKGGETLRAGQWQAFKLLKLYFQTRECIHGRDKDRVKQKGEGILPQSGFRLWET